MSDADTASVAQGFAQCQKPERYIQQLVSHWGRYRGLADMLKQPSLDGHLMNNVYFDTCVYHQPGVNLLAEVIETKNILFGSEMVGAVRGIDPQTGHYFDDTKRYVDALPISDEQRHAIFEGNARRVFPRLDAKLKGLGK